MVLKFKKLNSNGFAHHLLLPIVVIVLIAAIGTYLIVKSSATTITGSGGATWHLVKSYSTDFSVSKNTTLNVTNRGITTYKGKTYRACITAKASASSVNADFGARYAGTYPGGYSNGRINFYTTYKTACTSALHAGATHSNYLSITNYSSTEYLKVTTLKWERLY